MQKIIADNINMRDVRLTSLIITIPRIVLAEFNTHRVLSRNSASSRAIPFEKMLKMVQDDPFIPIKWMKDHSGMQGNEFFTEKLEIETLEKHWLRARDISVNKAKELSEFNLTKQIVNRLLEPFMWHTIICTATEWDNFIKLRAHSAAEIHIQEAAYQVLEALNNSVPKEIEAGQWHIPFGDNIDEDRLENNLYAINYVPKRIINKLDFLTHAKLEIATARCARVSYMNYEGKDDYLADLRLFDNLVNMGHLSPFEHCATPALPGEAVQGNFRGWHQLRHMISVDDIEERLIKHSLGYNK